MGPETNEEIVVPEKGQVVGGLIKLLDSVAKGEVAPEVFASLLPRVREGLGVFLGGLESRLDQPDAQGDELKAYVAGVQERVKYIHFLFMKSIDELDEFTQDGDPRHLSLGGKLAEDAEENLIKLVAMLKEDSVEPSSELMETID